MLKIIIAKTKEIKLPVFWLLIVSLIFIISCGSEKLNRQKAAELIKNTNDFKNERNYVYFNSEAVEKGEKFKLWKKSSFEINITKKGLKYFTEVENNKAKLSNPTDIYIEVTGITNAPIDTKAKLAHLFGSIPS